KKMDTDSTDIWEKLEAEYLSYPASGIHNHGTYLENYLQKHSTHLWEHMKGCWSKLAELK
uniref:hypothetical protein n=1 Tax=Enterocloster clostridioformis TaxID=1531 RepID=UPI0026E3C10C